MARRKIELEQGNAALHSCSEALQKDQSPTRNELFTAVRFTLEELAERLPGKAVEVRVPPAGAVQILGGTTHRRGTPPAVIECEPLVWLKLCLGLLNWDQARSEGLLLASGERTDLSTFLPL
ncbi:hypothetical protein BSR29_07070 [Boudabousia liubingyangii]|uniref:Bacterial SCP orthologue domain-containing protein n=1 Tax=Boudabousia liubingyangii TaxID=1921764 RepID=A0A1Q5PK38_9ACTO|nr:sterol carrier family protein [Boudabousia liubingyangii]OKL46577.1 hypothetical protein BSR29_07070 [Boudabousia liubingyangii]